MFLQAVQHQKDAVEIANSEKPDQPAPFRISLIRVFTLFAQTYMSQYSPTCIRQAPKRYSNLLA